MSLKPQTKIIIPAANTLLSAVALSQTVALNGFVNINGALAEDIVIGQKAALNLYPAPPPPAGQVFPNAMIQKHANIIKLGYGRTITITSAGNLTTSDFTVTGIQNGYPVTAVIAGPNNGTTDTASVIHGLFDVVTSIQVSGAAAAVAFTVGLGKIAATRPLRVNWDNPNFNIVGYGLSILNPNAALTVAYATQIMTYNATYYDMTNNSAAYGVYTIKAANNDLLDIIPFGDGTPTGLGTSTFWDAFFVAFTFVDLAGSGQVWFPQIGR